MNNMIPFPAPPRMTPQGGQGQQAQANPLRMIMGQVMQGMSPAGIVERIGGPQASQARQIISGKNQAQLKSIAYNMAKQRGVDLAQVAAQMGINLPG